MSDKPAPISDALADKRVLDLREATTNGRRAMVRPNVTYLLVVGYTGIVAAVVGYMLWTGNVDGALSALAPLGTLAAAVVSFWFAGREQTK